jgi:[ribosomal protein S5]-alanine N-acetyltransferase
VAGVVLSTGRVRLREIRYRDARMWRAVRQRNEAWLRPWEATVPDPVGEPLPTFTEMVRRVKQDAKAGRCLPFVVELIENGRPRLVGQLTVGSIVYGSLRGAHIGYWVDEAVAGRGIIPTCVALAADHCFGTLGLHRIEVAIRPENLASLRVVEKLGLTSEGIRRKYLHIDGDWRDHLIFAAVAEDFQQGMLASWQARHAELT